MGEAHFRAIEHAETDLEAIFRCGGRLLEMSVCGLGELCGDCCKVFDAFIEALKALFDRRKIQ